MSYTEQAEKINIVIKEILKRMEEKPEQICKNDIKSLINQIIHFGQVAKYRCRNNIAYDNFSKEVFKDIVELERIKPEFLEFDVLRVKTE